MLIQGIDGLPCHIRSVILGLRAEDSFSRVWMLGSGPSMTEGGWGPLCERGEGDCLGENGLLF
ncbi:hypothetical protein GCM10007923_43710 [Shinella yambaruensis]|uniref:Uncharacterized protein n=1 Tax=Shinella yambaruensis TaxID=415996 RepID=A0ABQ5ZQ35_9HYPH|nr:hypothetical protein GCM10007923_43710 [Shinella yambaruensis]